MTNSMKYIKNLEAVGFERTQAEAQVQMVLDAIEGDLVAKSDFTNFQERIDNRIGQLESRLDNRVTQLESRLDNRITQLEERTERRFVENEFRIITRLGLLTVSTTSIAVALLVWLIKI